MIKNLILGAGISGLSCSYHLGHDDCIIIEKKTSPFGHIASEFKNGYTWDQGPHISFTKNEYVRKLFSDSVGAEYEEYEVIIRNYYKGRWIDHPAQSFFYQIPEPLRSECLNSFLDIRERNNSEIMQPKNYLEWLEAAYGKVFSQTFPVQYTKKYWARDAQDLTIDWIGERMTYPSIEEVMNGLNRENPKSQHYINAVRYPSKGGFQAFAKKMLLDAQIKYSEEVVWIDLANKRVMTSGGECYEYIRLINTLPLPLFIQLCNDVPRVVVDAANSLDCTQVSLINIEVPHPPIRDETWAYIYDKDKFSTRVNRTEALSPNNAPKDSTGIQVEVYSSRNNPITVSENILKEEVVNEMGLIGYIDPKACRANAKIEKDLTTCRWANVIFDHDTKPSLQIIWNWLEHFGLQRESDDLHPLTNWTEKQSVDIGGFSLIMAGRYGQWKYYWTDDCVLRGKYIAECVRV